MSAGFPGLWAIWVKPNNPRSRHLTQTSIQTGQLTEGCPWYTHRSPVSAQVWGLDPDWAGPRLCLTKLVKHMPIID